MSYTASNSGKLIELKPSTVSATIGPKTLSVLLTDYTSYAFVDSCFNTNSNTNFEEHVVLMLRSLATPALTVLPIIGNVLSSMNSLTGYVGGPLEYVYHDAAICQGL